jgi:hypothetical protein
MGTFINDKTIQTIIHEWAMGEVEIIETTMHISPFGFPGKRTYITTYKDKEGEIHNVQIPGDVYSEVYKDIKLKEDRNKKINKIMLIYKKQLKINEV